MERANLVKIIEGQIYVLPDNSGKRRPMISISDEWDSPYRFIELSSKQGGKSLPIFLRQDDAISFAKVGYTEYRFHDKNLIQSYGKTVSKDFLDMIKNILVNGLGMPINKDIYYKTIDYINEYNVMVDSKKLLNVHNEPVFKISIDDLYNDVEFYDKYISANTQDSIPASNNTTTNIDIKDNYNKKRKSGYTIDTSNRENITPIRHCPIPNYASTNYDEFNIESLPKWFRNIIIEGFKLEEDSSEIIKKYCYYINLLCITPANRSVNRNTISKKLREGKDKVYNITLVLKCHYECITNKIRLLDYFVDLLSANSNLNKTQILEKFNNWLYNDNSSRQSLALEIGVTESIISNKLHRTFGTGTKERILKRIGMIDQLIDYKPATNTKLGGEYNPKGYPAKKRRGKKHRR